MENQNDQPRRRNELRSFPRRIGGLILVAVITILFLWPLPVQSVIVAPFPVIPARQAQQESAEEVADKTADKSDSFTDEQIEFFEFKVRPLLVDHCFECHGPEVKKPDGGLSLASRASIIAGGDTGPAMEPGDASESLIIEAINYDDVYEMPPDSKLPDEAIATLTEWVEMGAPWPDADQHVVTAAEFDIAKLKSEHWCWQAVAPGEIPDVVNRDWPKDPIDNFILSQLEAAGLNPAAGAARRSLIRRLSFDLTGMPPTVAEIEAFLNDSSDNAVEKVVDRLLASPRFGEHWARHWMDLVRYAETGGHEFDYPIPDAWQYRDYLIRAFNADVPYNDLIREHIAGDLIADPRRHPEEQYNESILGTGFWFLGEDFHAPVDVRADQVAHFDNQIDVMTKTFLGMTVACARCHDHKFDAIATKDFYALAGYLKSSRRQEAMLDPGRRIETAFTETSRRHQETQKDAATLLAAIRQNARENYERVNAGDEVEFEKYLQAAYELLRHDPNWGRLDAVVLEGESLTDFEVSTGTVEPQEIEPREGFNWRDNKQLWWRDGKTDDVLTINFDVDTSAATTFDLFANFTKANDYGIVTLALNDEILLSDLDCFANDLTTSGRMPLGKVELETGRAKLEIRIVGSNTAAIDRQMFGLDYLELIPVTTGGESLSEEALADREGLDPVLLKRLVAAIKSPALSAEFHPLRLMQELSKAGFVDGPADQRNKFRAQIENAQRKSEQEWDSVLFADFSSGIPEGWFRTGFAFGDNATVDATNDGVDERGAPAFSADGPVVTIDGTVSSAVYGGRFRGVLRSPTFTIEHDTIHYRLAGESATIRVIVENHVMDRYNALLFGGLSFDLAGNADQPAHDLHWQVQTGDLKLQKGHQAYIEIVDHDDGWIAIDEIRFSDHAEKRVTVPANLNETAGILLADSTALPDSRAGDVSVADTDIQTTATSSVAPVSETRTISGSVLELIADGGEGSSSVVSWIIENNLGSLIASGEESNLQEGIDRLKRARTSIRETAGKAPAPFFAPAMTDGTVEDEFVLIRGNHKTPGEIVPRRFLTALHGDGAPEHVIGSGRLELAAEIAAAENPLTSRVMVNRLWHHLTGRGIVGSVDNFGVLGTRPTHPQLLDFLASEFTRDGWSLKRMIRRIVLTRTYQMSTIAAEPEQGKSIAEIDPDNRLMHRANVRRITAQSIRDSMLQVSGELNEQMYGAPVPIHLTEFMEGRGRPESGPLLSEGRRSIYISVHRNFLSQMMLAFDSPIPLNTIGRRNRSNVPAQALILMNDPLVIELASRWAERLLETDESKQKRIERIFVEATGAPPTTAQFAAALEFLHQQATELNIPPDEIDSHHGLWADFCHVVFNTKQFIYLE